MKQLLFVFLIVFVGIKAQGQPSLDIGFFGGAGTYFGDMTKIELSKSVNPAYAAFVRYNFNPRYGIRFNVLNGNIGAQGEFDTKSITSVSTGNHFPDGPTYWGFKKNVLDISFQFEFNFLKYIVGDKTTPYSPYIFGGVGIQQYRYQDYHSYLINLNNVKSEFAPTIPFGLGFKFNLSKRIGLGLEGGLRKTFSDNLDDLNDPLSYKYDEVDKVWKPFTKYTDRYHNNDWTAYAGIHLVYKLMYGYKQWILRTPKEKILDWGIENNPNNR